MIHETAGDILLTKAQAIAHGVAPNDHFATGLALSLREQWPAMHKDFRHFVHTSHPKEGGAWIWGGTGGRKIISLFTQQPAPNEHAHPGKASVSNVNHALKELHRLVETEKITSLALPKLATGVGGLSWEVVLPLIQSHLGSLKIPVILYTIYQKGVAAKEAL